MKKLAQKILLLCISLTVSLLFAELIVSALKPQDLSGSWGEQTERGLIVNKSAGGARHQYGARVVHYSFTAPHLRAPAPKASVKVLVLGDSYTFGYLLDQRDTYVNLLQTSLDKEYGRGVFSLLNAAVGGWGAGDYVAFVEDFGEEIAPDIILVFLNTDDVGRALRSPLWNFSLPDARLTRAVMPSNRLKVLVNGLHGYQWLLEHSHLVQLARNQAVLISKKGFSPTQISVSPRPGSERSVESARHGRALGKALFQRLATWCEERNVRLLIATTGCHTPPYADSLEPTEAFMADAEPLFSGLGVPFSDPSDILRQRMSSDPDKYIIKGDGHPTEAGAALIAEHTLPFVKSQLSNYCRLTNRCKELNGAHP
ncbi:MAG: SGNH/GDSL hydrolase family protein [Pyrinomonadaceae bacterium]